MALTMQTLVQLVTWCATSPQLRYEREEQESIFFGASDPRPVRYWPGAQDPMPRQLRFLGWFSLSCSLPGGEHPAELAAGELLRGLDRQSAIRSIQGARYVTAIVTRTTGGQELALELEQERFEVRSKPLAQVVERDQAVAAHLLPLSHRWLLGPGWLVLPFRYGSGMRERLKEFQWDPITLERFLEGRVHTDEAPKPEPVRDPTLAAAIERITAAAVEAGVQELVLSMPEWKALMQPFILTRDSNGLGQELLRRVGSGHSIDALNRWLDLLMNVWNNTPQPDRGGKSANELIAEAQTPPVLELRSGEMFIPTRRQVKGPTNRWQPGGATDPPASFDG